MPLHTNTFKGGLDLDTDVTAYDNTHYPYALNLRLISDGTNSSGTLSSMEDSTTMFSIPTNYTVVGKTILNDYLIMFLKHKSTSSGRIYKIPFSAIVESVNITPYLMVDKQFAFGNEVEVLARYETNLVQKVYWVDGTNVVRFANLGLSSAELSALNLDAFNIVQEVTLSTPELTEIVAGEIDNGIVQYAYCLYNLNGSETGYSAATNIIPLSDSSLTETTSLRFKGGNLGTNSGKGVKITINNVDTDFDRIRVIRLHTTTTTGLPIVTIVYEGVVQSTVVVTDTGGLSLGSLTIDDYRYIPNIFFAKTITSKNNYLFTGNIVEETFNIDFDARAYRFKIYSGANYARVYNEDGSYYQMQSSTNYYPYYYNSSHVLQSIIETSWAIPETADCINSFNVITNDGNSNHLYKYTSALTLLGGSGKFITYNFVANGRVIDSAYTDGSDLRVYTTSNSTGYQDLSNPILVNETLGYQRDEIYRFGIVLFDKYGRQSFVKWIGDIRFPSEVDGWWYSISGNNQIRDIGVQFTLNSDAITYLNANNIYGWQIVRAERTYSEATIKDCGYISSLTKDGSVVTWRSTPTLSLVANPTLKLLEYITPETNYNKNNYTSYDRLDSYTANELTAQTYKNTNIAGPSAATFKYNATVAEESSTRILLENSKLFKYVTNYSKINLSDLGYNLQLDNVVTFRTGTVGILHYRTIGAKGTTLILKTDTDIASSGKKYVRRRSYLYPYGGGTYNAKVNTIYYPCSPIFLMDNSSTQDVYGGDCYIGWFEYMRGIWNYEGGITNSVTKQPGPQIAYLLVESKINLKYTVNPTWSQYDDGVIADYGSGDLAGANYTYMTMRETRGVYLPANNTNITFTQDFDLYTYNPVYSQMDKSRVFVAKPLDFISTNEVNTRIYRTSKKINGEASDSWTKFLQNNYMDVDTAYEGLTKLLVFNDRLIYFQPKGIGTVAVAEREVVTTNSGSSTTIGTGGVMERYDYISNTSGASTLNSIDNSTKAVYYIDSDNRKLCRLSEGVEFLSDLKGVKSFIDSKNFTNLGVLFNNYNNEVWFRLDSDILMFNEYINTFVSFTDEIFKFGVNYEGNTYTFNTALKKLDTPNVYKDIQLKLTIAPTGQYTSRFDSLTFSSIVDRNNTIQDKSFSTITLNNNFQTKSSGAFYPPARNRFRQFMYNDMRDNNGDRLFDSYCNVILTFTKQYSNERLRIRDVVTNYMPINAR